MCEFIVGARVCATHALHSRLQPVSGKGVTPESPDFLVKYGADSRLFLAEAFGSPFGKTSKLNMRHLPFAIDQIAVVSVGTS